MTDRRHKKITLTEIASAKGTSLAKVSRDARDGDLGIIQRQGRRALVDIDEAEAYVGRSIPDSEIDAIRDRTRPLFSQTLNIDKGWIRFGADVRDDQWARHLLAHGIDHIEPPPYDQLQVTELAIQKIFTLSQVCELLEGAVRQRDKQWEEWAIDPLIRTKYPIKPPTLEFKYPDPLEE